jgi:hypothetical protein
LFSGGSCNSDCANSTNVSSLAFSNAFGGAEYGYFRNESNNSGGGGGAGRKYQSEAQWQIQQTFMIGAAILGILSLFCGFTTAYFVKEQRHVTG